MCIRDSPYVFATGHCRKFSSSEGALEWTCRPRTFPPRQSDLRFRKTPCGIVADGKPPAESACHGSHSEHHPRKISCALPGTGPSFVVEMFRRKMECSRTTFSRAVHTTGLLLCSAICAMSQTPQARPMALLQTRYE